MVNARFSSHKSFKHLCAGRSTSSHVVCVAFLGHLIPPLRALGAETRGECGAPLVLRRKSGAAGFSLCHDHFKTCSLHNIYIYIDFINDDYMMIIRSINAWWENEMISPEKILTSFGSFSGPDQATFIQIGGDHARFLWDGFVGTGQDSYGFISPISLTGSLW